jgi:hypothetical protein
MVPALSTVSIPPPASPRAQAKARPPLCGWSAVATRVALTYAATIVVALAAHQAVRPDLIRSPKRVLAHLWESHEWHSQCCS